MTFRPGESGNLKGRPPKEKVKPEGTYATRSKARDAEYLAGQKERGKKTARALHHRADAGGDKRIKPLKYERESKVQNENRQDARQRVSRNDSWMNFATMMGTQHDKRTRSFFMPDIILDEEARGLWRADDICKKVIEAVPNTAFRRDFFLNLGDKDLSEKAKDALDALDITEKFVRAAHYENAYGGSAILMVTDDIEDLDVELDEENFQTLSALHVLEPRELVPLTYYSDLRSPKFGLPEIWRFIPMIAGVATTVQYIHESRLVVFPGTRVTRQIQMFQRPGFGDSALSGVYSIIRDFGSSWGTAAALLQDFAQGVLSMDGYKELMKEKGGEEIVKARARLFDTMRSTIRMGIVDKGDTFARQTTPMGGLSDLLHDFMLRVAAAARQPVTVMFGMAPAGLNATGDNDVRGWYDEVASIRSHRYKPRLKRIVEVYLKSKQGVANGNLPDAWAVEFPPLWEPTEKEQAETRYLIAQTDEIYYNIGAATGDDIAESRWKGDTYSAEMIIDWVRRKKQAQLELTAAKEAQKLAMVQAQQAGATGANANDPNADPNAPKAGTDVDTAPKDAAPKEAAA